MTDDLRAVLERKRREVQPRPDAFERLAWLRRRRMRNRRIGTIVMVAAVLAAAGWALRSIAALDSAAPERRRPAGPPQVRVARTIPVGTGVLAGIAATPGSVWVGSNAVPGVVRIDVETGRVVAAVQTHRPPEASAYTHLLVSDVVAAYGSVWTVDQEFGTVSRVDPERNRVIATIPVSPYPTAIVDAAGSLWVVSVDGTVTRIHPATNRPVATLDVSGSAAEAADIAGDDDAVWVATETHVLAISPRSTRVIERIAVHRGQGGIAVGGDAVWAARRPAGVVERISTTGGPAEGVPVGPAPDAVVAAFGVLWVSDVRDGTVSVVDPATGRVVETVPAGRGASDIAVAGSSIWVLNQIDGTATEIRVSGVAR